MGKAGDNGRTGDAKASKVLLYTAVFLTCALGGFFGKQYPNIDLGLRLVLPMYTFGWLLHYFRDSLRSSWLWLTVGPLFVAHWLLVSAFLTAIRSVNFFLWLMLVLAEMVILVLVVASASPEARAARKPAGY